MLEELLKKSIFPSPLILEGSKSTEWIHSIVNFALCETNKACGTCRSCRQIKNGFHPDWLALAGNVKIDEVRETLRLLRQRPYESKRRVLSFDGLQDANAYVQNALLKTFEEPLDYWVLLAGVNSRFGLLPTIRSRCLLYRDDSSSRLGETLSPSESRVYETIRDLKELDLQKDLESILKDRQKAKSAFHKILEKASQEQYPGHWQNFAPCLEESLWGLSRNLNPKILWDSAWAKSFVPAL